MGLCFFVSSIALAQLIRPCDRARVNGAELRNTAARKTILEFYKSTAVWVVDFTYDGHPRRWLKALPAGTDAWAHMEALVKDLYGPRGRIVEVRPATRDEETQFIRGDLPRNLYCPTSRGAERGER